MTLQQLLEDIKFATNWIRLDPNTTEGNLQLIDALVDNIAAKLP